MAAKTRLIGSKWTTPTGIWEVTEMVKPGLYRVVTTDKRRVGEMYAGDIRKAIAAAELRKANHEAQS